jgi:nucleoprotein TPR
VLRWQSKADTVAQSTSQLRTQLSTLQSSHHKTTSELSVLQTRIEIIEREKKELFEETELLQERSTRTNRECKRGIAG